MEKLRLPLRTEPNRRPDAMQNKRRSGRASTKTSLEDEIAHLRGLDLGGLRARWQSVDRTDARETGPAMFTRLASFDQKRTELTPGTVLVREWDRRSHRSTCLVS